MKHFCYLIFSEELNNYYIGETENINIRLNEHNTGTYSGSYTSKANDWKLIWSLACESKNQAKQIEKHIKKMKSRLYLENLLKYPELKLKLLLKYPAAGSSR